MCPPPPGWQSSSLHTSRCQADISVSTQTFYTHCAQRRDRPKLHSGTVAPGTGTEAESKDLNSTVRALKAALKAASFTQLTNYLAVQSFIHEYELETYHLSKELGQGTKSQNGQDAEKAGMLAWALRCIVGKNSEN